VTSTRAATELDTEAALKVLANAGQRRVLELVTGSEISSGELADACGWTRAATSQTLRALRDSALVDVRVAGNRRLYRANQQNLRQLRAFLDEFWSTRLGVLGAELSQL
jgi:DNA-binding transcriptional ArsR family regulator